MSDSILPPELVRAYRETHYRVDDAQPLTLRVGHRCLELDAAHERAGVACSAYVTACNPLSEDIGGDADAARHAALAEELSRSGLEFIEGEGRHPGNGWPPEPSFLVFGIALEAAEALGRRWDQNAIVWSDRDAVPHLILLR